MNTSSVTASIGINLQALTLEQLNQLKQQLEEVREAASRAAHAPREE